MTNNLYEYIINTDLKCRYIGVLKFDVDILILTYKEVLLLVSYDKLWKKLIELKMTKKELKGITSIGSTTMSKLINNEPVSMSVMIKICLALKCNIGDIMDVIL